MNFFQTGLAKDIADDETWAVTGSPL